MAEPSTRAKWRAPRSARVSTLKKCLTAPTLSETPDFVNYPCGPTTETSLLHLGGIQVDGLGCAGGDADVLGDVRMALRKIEREIAVVCDPWDRKQQVISGNHPRDFVLTGDIRVGCEAITRNPAKLP